MSIKIPKAQSLLIQGPGTEDTDRGSYLQSIRSEDITVEYNTARQSSEVKEGLIEIDESMQDIQNAPSNYGIVCLMLFLLMGIGNQW